MNKPSFSLNSNLQLARKEKFDEFYTERKDIEKEVFSYSKECFYKKRVYLNADSENSEFWKFFMDNFNELGLLSLVATHYTEGKRISTKLSRLCGPLVEVKKDVIFCNGDFRSPSCRSLLEQVDVVVTNPPFSLFREYIDVLFEAKKINPKLEFLVLGNINATGYKNVFEKIKNKELFLGFNHGTFSFSVPKDGGMQKQRFGNICWFTTFRETSLKKPFLPTISDKDISDFEWLDNYSALDINKIKEIPKLYDVEMSVPMTLLLHLNLNQFDIVGADFELAGDVVIDGKLKKKPQRFYKNGKRKFARLVVKLKNPEEKYGDNIRLSSQNSKKLKRINMFNKIIN